MTDHEDEYKWHTGKKRPSGVPDAVEFVEVHKAFGRNKILRGLNMGIPNDKISMILGPSGTGKSVCIKHMNFPLRTRCHFAVTVAIGINCYNFYIDQSRGNRIASLPRVNGIGI